MVGIVTGKINSGKTTRMKALHQTHGGDGFIMVKTMDGQTVKSYHVLRLSTGEQRLLVLREGYNDLTFKEVTRIGPYRFDRHTLAWMEATMQDLIHSGVSPLYLDEVGKLELKGEGFHSILKAMIASDKACFISMREDLVHPITQAYQLNAYLVKEGNEKHG